MDEVELAVQVNGKVRSHIKVATKATKDEIEKIALADENVKMHLQDVTVRKVIVIPNKIVNIVVG